MPIMPSVTMNGIMRNPAMTPPLNSPIIPPARIVSAPATQGGKFFTRRVAPSTLVSATIDPTLKSMPPLTMIMVIPSAPIETMTVWTKMILKLAPVRKYGRTSGTAQKIPMTSTKPKNGPSALRSCPGLRDITSGTSPAVDSAAL